MTKRTILRATELKGLELELVREIFEKFGLKGKEKHLYIARNAEWTARYTWVCPRCGRAWRSDSLTFLCEIIKTHKELEEF